MADVPAPQVLHPFLEKVKVGNPTGHKNLTLVPLLGERHGQLDYILAVEAIEAGTLTVEEVRGGGSVPELKVVSTSDSMILLIDAEELIGAKQNRVLNTSILLPPRVKAKIPVSCVEQGRWRDTSAAFAPGEHAPSSLRARKSHSVGRSLRSVGVADSDQGEVWDAVSFSIARADVASPTMAMHDLHERHRGPLEAYLAALPYPAGARGVIVAIAGNFVAMDLFDRLETLEALWPRLIPGYAVDAILWGEAKHKEFTAKGASVLLERLGQIECQPCPSVGLGEDWRFEAEDLLGEALVFDDVCVHMSAFPNEQSHRSRRAPDVLPPSRRRLRRQGRGSEPEDVL